MKAFVPYPSICGVSYECVSVTGSSISVKCNDVVTVNFNSNSGSFIFTTFDKETYSPGVYSFTVRGKSGTKFPV
jgi:hypothetical protein